ARVGRGGSEFTVLMFRTMVPYAAPPPVELLAHNENDGALFKIREDPRVTTVGRWLRRYSLDELPQLINVLRGEMSLVGPRPPLPEEVAQYGGDVYRRLVVKPGLTGLWQVSGRSDLSWEESVRLDLRYVDNWTLALDLQIMWKTWSAVFRGSGAYWRAPGCAPERGYGVTGGWAAEAVRPHEKVDPTDLTTRECDQEMTEEAAVDDHALAAELAAAAGRLLLDVREELGFADART